ncbi:MAG: hypothetical protein LBC80_07795 [Treponema sp.]|jgi:hypothetical protein|nr:hypothetical protein [Treponema sp.]
MKLKKLFFALTVLIFTVGILPLAAQNSPAGGLVSGNIINRDTDTYMMVNFAPFLNYERHFTFVQGAMTNFGPPGLSAGYATKMRGTFFNFYLNTDGLSLNNSTTENKTTAVTTETSTNRSHMNLQFDTIIGSADFGSLKFGLLFAENFGHTVTEKTDEKTTTKSGFFTPSIAYARNFINEDYSMLLLSGTVRFRLPNDFSRVTKETTSGGITTTTTTSEVLTSPLLLQYPGFFPTSSRRLEIEPQMWYFFTPQLAPMVVISHIYLVNTFIMQFFPEEIGTIKTTGVSNGYTRQEREYIGNTLFGYYNVLYVINSRFSVAWRVNFSAGFFHIKEGHTRTMDPGDTTETVDRTSRENLYLMACVAPRLAFSWHAVPATLTLNGAIVLNQLGPTNAIGWQQYRIKTTDEDEGTVTTAVENIFTPIKPYFNVGAVWNISPFLAIESGITVSILLPPQQSFDLTGGPGRHLDNISIGVVYKR